MNRKQAIVAAIETHCRALTEGDREGWLTIWADDAVLEDPVGVDTYRGVEALRTVFWPVIQSISPMRLWLKEDVLVCGHEAVAILAAEVTFEGAPRRTDPIVDHFTFDDQGKVAAMRAFWKYD